MLYRKIEKIIEEKLKSNSKKILLINGARQVGKSFIIRHVGRKLFKNYVEINLLEDSLQAGNFKNIRGISDFYFQLSMVAGEKLGNREDTLIFLDEIQAYPELLTLLKFLREDNKFTFIASGSLLGVTLAKTTSIPIGSIEILEMFALSFEEFLYANGFSEFAIDTLREKFLKEESLDESAHNKILDLFKKFLLIGGLPEAVNCYVETRNIVKVREIQNQIYDFYSLDASKYDDANKLKIRRIYSMIPSMLENKKKRIVIKDIENIKGKTYSSYIDEFDYLISSGIALEVKAISNPVFPLLETSSKNLIKLYLNDVGILTALLYKNNIRAVLDDIRSINLGSVYESAVASILKANGKKLFYYDNRNTGEVDFLIDDYDALSILPIEVKSGKDYTIHSALSKMLSNTDYGIKKGIVLSNNREIKRKGGIVYLPIYYAMFL